MTRRDRLIAILSFVVAFVVLFAIGAALGALGAIEIIILLVLAIPVGMVLSRLLRTTLAGRSPQV